MRARGTRIELAAIALALLVPIPLFVASGLRLPLPGAVDRALASLGSDAVFGPAEVEATPSHAGPDTGTSNSVASSPPAGGRRATSSTTLIVGTVTAPSDGDGADQAPGGRSTPAAGDDTRPPEDETETEPTPDAPAPPQETPTAPVEVEAATAVENGPAAVEVNVTGVGVEVVVAGESADVPVPIPVPVPAPSLP